MRVVSSGLVREHTGIGVVQRFLYPGLQKLGIDLELAESRDAGDGPIARIVGLVRGFRRPQGDSDVYLSLVPPLPFGMKGSVVTIVHDLRWQRTRRGMSRIYRALDLRRTVSRSDVIICISERTQADLEQFDQRAKDKTVIALEGPGIVPEGSFVECRDGSLLLIGSATHKRNELAAEVAVRCDALFSSVVGVNLSTEAQQVLDAKFAGRTAWRADVTREELVKLYQGSQYFMFLGIEEGFGLPFLESLSAGCEVIAIEQPLTRELLGEGAVLLQDGNVASVAEQLLGASFPSAGLRRSVARQYSWDRFCEAVCVALLRVAGSRTEDFSGDCEGDR